jgi:hypothetical protein
MSTPDPRRVSDQLVRLVQLLFGLVAVQPLLLYGDVFVQPFTYEHRTAVFALLAVYVTTVSSWIDWHITMEANPYDIYRGWEKAAGCGHVCRRRVRVLTANDRTLRE